MTPGRKDNHELDLSALVCQLQQLAEQIRCQVDRELARTEQSRYRAAQQSQPISDTLKKHQEIYSLAEQGLEPLEIARQTGKTLGEVQVILALRKSE